MAEMVVENNDPVGYHDGIYLVDGNGQGIRIEQSPTSEANMTMIISEDPICIQINQSMRDLRTVLVVPGGPNSAPAGCSTSSVDIKEETTPELNEGDIVVPPPPVNRRRRSRNKQQRGSSRRSNGGNCSSEVVTPPGYSTLPINEVPSDVVPEINPPIRTRVTRIERELPPPPPPPPVRRQEETSLRGMLLNVLQGDKPWCCCCINQTVSIRWFIIVIFMIGICCTVTGTVLGATRFNGASNKEHFTLSLLMIGVGVVLLTVSGIAWKMTSSSLNSNGDCSAMLGLNSINSNRFNNNSRGGFYARPPPNQHPYSAMMYPEMVSPHPANSSNFREPPPSYAASMQEYRLRLLLYERSNPTFVPNFYNPPPPYYHYHPNFAGSGGVVPIHHHHHHNNRRYAPMAPHLGGPHLPHHHIPMQQIPHLPPPQVPSTSVDYYNSRPPSYRSRCSMDQPREILVEESPPPVTSHTRDPSIISYLSHQSGDNMSVVSEHTVNLQSPTGRSTVVTVLHAVSNCEEKDNVTIVQTNSDNTNSSSVVVTVSGNNQWQQNDCVEHEQCYNNSVQILAHL